MSCKQSTYYPGGEALSKAHEPPDPPSLGWHCETLLSRCADNSTDSKGLFRCTAAFGRTRRMWPNTGHAPGMLGGGARGGDPVAETLLRALLTIRLSFAMRLMVNFTTDLCWLDPTGLNRTLAAGSMELWSTPAVIHSRRQTAVGKQNQSNMLLSLST